MLVRNNLHTSYYIQVNINRLDSNDTYTAKYEVGTLLHLVQRGGVWGLGPHPGPSSLYQM